MEKSDMQQGIISMDPPIRMDIENNGIVLSIGGKSISFPEMGTRIIINEKLIKGVREMLETSYNKGLNDGFLTNKK